MSADVLCFPLCRIQIRKNMQYSDYLSEIQKTSSSSERQYGRRQFRSRKVMNFIGSGIEQCLQEERCFFGSCNGPATQTVQLGDDSNCSNPSACCGFIDRPFPTGPNRSAPLYSLSATIEKDSHHPWPLQSRRGQAPAITEQKDCTGKCPTKTTLGTTANKQLNWRVMLWIKNLIYVCSTYA